jgi:hypothetical protein
VGDAQGVKTPLKKPSEWTKEEREDERVRTMAVSFAAALCLFGNYAFDAGIVTVSCKSQGQGFLVSRYSIIKRTGSNTKIHQKVYRDTTFGGCGSFSSRVILLVKGKE